MKNKLHLLFEDDAILAISKPANIGFHVEDNQPGIFEQAKSQFSLTELYPVHRLDKVTSGVLVFAKTQSYAALLGELFEKREVEKTYLALSDKKPKKKQGKIKGDMHKSRDGSYKLTRSQQNPAITQFTSHSIGQGKRLYILQPKTGKTHQLRVMMKSISAPIIGDDRYGGSKDKRTYLHALSISFSLDNTHYSVQDFDSIKDWDIDPLPDPLIQLQSIKQSAV